MSSCFFISANSPLKEIEDNISTINLDNPQENDISIFKMSYYEDIYSGMKYANEINCPAIGNRQVQQIFDYIIDVMRKIDIVELWQVWLPDYGRPITKTKEILLSELRFDYLYDYLLKLEKAPYFTQPLHDEDEENSIYYRLKIYK